MKASDICNEFSSFALHAILESFKLKRSIVVPQFSYSDFLNPKHRYHHSHKNEENPYIGHVICMCPHQDLTARNVRKKYQLNSKGP